MFKKELSLLLITLLSILLFHPSAEARALVNGQYTSSSGTNIVLNLNILNPAPANLIVEQYLSPNNKVVGTSPRAKKGSAGKIKWLFRNTASGGLSISIQLSAPLQGRIRGVVRYRDPVGGNFVEFQISP